jgi:UDPglucose 6-dehydrogenase
VKICMIGAGYVGLVSAACFSEFGWTVTCVDKDPGSALVELEAGRSRSMSPGSTTLIAAQHARRPPDVFTMRSGPAVSGADVVFLAVGTPMRRGDGYADLSYVFRRRRSWRRISMASRSSRPSRRCRSAPAARSSGA